MIPTHEALLKDLKSDDEKIVVEALRFIGSKELIEYEDIVLSILRDYRNQPFWVTQKAEYAVGCLRSAKAVKILFDISKDKEYTEDIGTCVFALDEISNEEVAIRLLEVADFLFDRGYDTQLEAITLFKSLDRKNLLNNSELIKEAIDYIKAKRIILGNALHENNEYATDQALITLEEALEKALPASQ